MSGQAPRRNHDGQSIRSVQGLKEGAVSIFYLSMSLTCWCDRN